MKKVEIIIHQNYIEETIKNLHKTGLIQIIDITNDKTDEIENATVHPELDTCISYELRVGRLISILNKIKPKKTGIKSFLKPELPEVKTIEECDLEDIYSYAEGILSEIEKRILNLKEKLDNFDEEKEKINQNINDLKFLKDFEFDLSTVGESQYVIIRAGKKIEWGVVVASHISEKEKIDRVFREYITEFIFEELKGNPQQIIDDLNNRLKEIKKQRKQIIDTLRKYAKEQLNDLFSLKEEIQVEKICMDVPKNFGKTKSTYFIKGWVLEKNEKELEEKIRYASNDHVVCSFEKPSVNLDNPPTYFETPRWAEGFRGLLEMFATPKYNEINPTIIMGIFFVLFFGVMLGDAGYGLIIFILSLYGYFAVGRYSSMIKSWSFMGMCLGFVTTVVGFLTNSFFGDFIPRFIYGDPKLPLYTLNVLGIQLPANPIRDPITILVIALILGLIHLNVGILLGLIQTLRNKEYKEFLTSKSCWVFLQLGGGILILSFLLGFHFSETITYIAIVLTIIGLIQLFVSTGPIGFFDITGYVGDWLSYARLLALGLATAGMALAFNVIAQLIGEMIPFVGIVVMIIILVFAHIINLGLQALGAGIHSLRLQYVEFFNRFYEGGGHSFSPFKISRKYTKIEEEKNMD